MPWPYPLSSFCSLYCTSQKVPRVSTFVYSLLDSLTVLKFKYQAAAWPLHLLLAPLPRAKPGVKTSAGSGNYVVITRITSSGGGEMARPGLGVMLWHVRSNVQCLLRPLVSTCCTCDLLSLLVSPLSLWSGLRDQIIVTLPVSQCHTRGQRPDGVYFFCVINCIIYNREEWLPHWSKQREYSTTLWD